MARDQQALNKYESLPCLRTFLLGVKKGVASQKRHCFIMGGFCVK